MNSRPLDKALGHPVTRETLALLNRYSQLLRAENEVQNLVAAGTLDTLWERHILDSAQLVRFQPDPAASWLDIGSGGGLPGLVIALLTGGPVTLCEPRRLRARFLERAAAELGLAGRVTVEQRKVEALSGRYDTITARAFAPLERIWSVARRLAGRDTRWILPRGRGGQSELEAALGSWQGAWRIEHSLTDSASTIIVASGVKPKRSAH